MQPLVSELASANDELLLQLARQGEREAIDLLFSRHMPILKHTALRFLRNEAEAEDVVQDTLTSAFVHLAQYEGRSQFRTWLLSILLNAARTKVRSRKRDRSLSLEEELEGPNADPIMKIRDPRPDPEQLTTARERRRIARQALGDLSPEFRIAYCLCYVEGMSAPEAAAILGVNRETFKVRLFRGKRKLKIRLSARSSESHEALSRARLTAAHATHT